MVLCGNHMLPPSASGEEARKHRFHLKPGELGQLVAGLKVIRCDERRTDDKDGRPAYVARLIARKE